jgi:ribosomal-protein-alanine N-acetyltransferase
MTSPFPAVDTARLRLRCVRPEDAEPTAALMTAEISRWVARWPMPFTPGMAAERIATSHAAARAGNALPFAIIEKASEAFSGWIVIHRDADDILRGSFGYWLGEACHGRGYMREAAPAALQAGFTLLGLDAIEAGAQPGNEASFAVIRACGMAPIGTRMVPAPARGRDELCHMFEIRRPAHPCSPRTIALPVPGLTG